MIRWVAVWIALLLWFLMTSVAGGDDWMVEVELPEGTVEGMPIAWSGSEVHLLARDGRLWHFAPSQVQRFRKTASYFRSYSVAELRAALRRELGPQFEVTATSHYLVAHPVGEGRRWAERFEDLYRAFVGYFAVRGFQLHDPPCPLVGIVCSTRAQFAGSAGPASLPANPAVVGYYSRETNRIYVLDQAQSASDQRGWRENQSTVIHEATHQLAFNMGVHSRYLDVPLWIAEGLATMFEAPGVYDGRSYPALAQRINRERLAAFLSLRNSLERGDWLEQLVASDELFRRSPGAAYAMAWAVTFYLSETRPGQYSQYLRRCNRREVFAPYPAEARLEDFTAVFGGDWKLLQAHLLRFIERLPK